MDLVEAKEREFDNTARHPWELARLDVARKIISRNIKLLDGSIVMDIGCGDTFFVESLATEFPKVIFFAVDTAFNDILINDLRSKLKVSNVFLFPSLDAAAPEIKKQVSLVILMDVIEHIEDDKGFLISLLQRNYIGSETNFLITVPAYQSLFCSHDTFLGHYRRYSNKMLREHTKEAGLKTIEIGYFFFSLIPVRLIQVFKENVLKIKPDKSTTGLATWNGGKTKSGIFKQILKLDANFSFFLKRIGIRLPGLSNYAICKRSV